MLHMQRLLGGGSFSMPRGQIAKEKVANKLAETFGDAWIGEVDKKYYVLMDDGGEKVQIAITLTCPKTPVGTGTVDISSAFGDGIDFSAAPVMAPVKAEPAEITEEEQQRISDLMKRLGLV